jgi:hypothetical protein
VTIIGLHKKTEDRLRRCHSMIVRVISSITFPSSSDNRLTTVLETQSTKREAVGLSCSFRLSQGRSHMDIYDLIQTHTLLPLQYQHGANFYLGTSTRGGGRISYLCMQCLIVTSSNEAYRILDINKLYTDLISTYLDHSPRGSQKRPEGRKTKQRITLWTAKLELLRMHDTFQRKVHPCGTILVPLPTKYRKSQSTLVVRR